MARPRPVEKIHAAAYHFARICTDRENALTEIAEAFEVSESTARKWTQTPEWDKALKVFGYEGDTKLAARDTEREQGETFTTVRDTYFKLLRAGEPVHRIPRLVEEKTGVDRRKISDWARRYNWKAEA